MNLLWLTPLAASLMFFVFGPLIAHLFRQPPSQKRHFGAMMLLLRLPKQLRRRRRIQDWLLLVLRILCIMLFVMAALQPVLRWPDSNTDLEQAKRMVLFGATAHGSCVGQRARLDDQTVYNRRSAMVEQIKICRKRLK